MTSALITADGPFRFFQRETFCVSRGQQEYGGVERGTGLLIRLSKRTVYSMWGKRHLNVAFNTFVTFLYSFCTPKIFESGAVSFKLLLLMRKQPHRESEVQIGEVSDCFLMAQPASAADALQGPSVQTAEEAFTSYCTLISFVHL